MSEKKIPMRMCIGCREMKPTRELMRIVKTPSGEVKTDRTGKLSGRGAYICPNPECVRQAAARKALSKAFEEAVPGEFYKELEKELGNT